MDGSWDSKYHELKVENDPIQDFPGKIPYQYKCAPWKTMHPGEIVLAVKKDYIWDDDENAAIVDSKQRPFEILGIFSSFKHAEFYMNILSNKVTEQVGSEIFMEIEETKEYCEWIYYFYYNETSKPLYKIELYIRDLNDCMPPHDTFQQRFHYKTAHPSVLSETESQSSKNEEPPRKKRRTQHEMLMAAPCSF